jgi:hypothetical protein
MIQQEQATSGLSVEALCEALDVSASGYYTWCERESSPRQEADVRLGDEIEQVFVESRRTYGSHWVWLVLREQGIRTSRKRVERLMRQRRFGLTRAGQSAYFAPNVLQQDFTATRKNEKWVTDTTYIPTRESWLYLVSVMDLFSRQIVSWAMGEQHDAELAVSALDDDHAPRRCRRCQNCLNKREGMKQRLPAPALAAAARQFLEGSSALPIEPRKMYPSGLAGVKGRIATPNMTGVALCALLDSGWGASISRQRLPDAALPDEIIRAAAKLLAEQWMDAVMRPLWVTAVPSQRHARFVADAAVRLVAQLQLPFYR